MTDDNPRTIWLQMMKLDQELRRLRTGFIFNAEPVRDLYRAALARAEAAEAEAARLQYDLDRQLYRADARAEEAEAERNALRAELGTALDHLATAAHYLEVLLATQQWRPVTEKPDKPGWYVVYDSDGHVFYNADIFPYRVARWTGKWDSAFNGLVDYWRPLPPAPQEPTP